MAAALGCRGVDLDKTSSLRLVDVTPAGETVILIFHPMRATATQSSEE
jgi:hypothetical protein